MHELTASITLTAQTAVVRRPTSSHVMIANVLGQEVISAHECVYLDRVVHRPAEKMEGWEAFGAISTVMHRSLPVPENEVS